jgi:hypothetical protein
MSVIVRPRRAPLGRRKIAMSPMELRLDRKEAQISAPIIGNAQPFHASAESSTR